MSKLFTRFAQAVSHVAGRPITFGLACGIIVVWAICGPLFGYSDTWQLVINTGTTIITFLMVFLIQNTQNRDGAAMQAKLDELILSAESARDEFIGIEALTDEDLQQIIAMCEQEAKLDATEPEQRDRMHRMQGSLSRLRSAPRYR